jgi:hypothetical protein
MSLIEVPAEKLDEIRNNKRSFLTPERVRNRIQCWASKYALNRCIEDMHEISKNLIFCVTLSGHEYESFVGVTGNTPKPDSWWDFEISIIRREDMREERRKDYVIFEKAYHAHLFFEIPIINSFTDEQILKWEDYCLRTLAKQVFYNKKKAKQWLKLKEIQSDFD